MPADLADAPDGKKDATFWVYEDIELLPTGAVMTSARKATFDERWPYAGRRGGWRPTSNKLSEAGFHYTPSSEDDDDCTCIYCGVELGGWERTDDPVHEHRRRRPECPFFLCILAEGMCMETAQSRKRSASVATEEEDEEYVEPKRTQPKRGTRTGSAQKATFTALSPDDELTRAARDAQTKPQDRRASATNPWESVDGSRIDADVEADLSIDVTETFIEEDATHTSLVEETLPTKEPQTSEAQTVSPKRASLAQRRSFARVSHPRSSLAVEEKQMSTEATTESSAEEDDLEVESIIHSEKSEPTPKTAQLPSVADFLPLPFPHLLSTDRPPPPVADPSKITVMEWAVQQQTYLLDIMRERIEARLSTVHKRNLEERRKLEKKLRA
ncbi:hypothetical protein MVES1_003987 [Malassezia vespertilionis]|uniref:BIR-domain-containing protein n=1 Tax=Malassezia vespertilionis TaxID=2020962 RepID=A0A2N1J807_9BASI|nr:uncharacterized protein MVES1_003987 [Malassezia vespertilionis]PKI82697.1 hypothetical protein MVES_003537 [Malassezia vespertilionis]WFD08611.1 hypothetical protein MVES1_003987 [Malassezia vespertilionis]